MYKGNSPSDFLGTVITDIAAFILLTVYEGVTNRHAIESMYVYTRC